MSTPLLPSVADRSPAVGGMPWGESPRARLGHTYHGLCREGLASYQRELKRKRRTHGGLANPHPADRSLRQLHRRAGFLHSAPIARARLDFSRDLLNAALAHTRYRVEVEVLSTPISK